MPLAFKNLSSCNFMLIQRYTYSVFAKAWYLYVLIIWGNLHGDKNWFELRWYNCGGNFTITVTVLIFNIFFDRSLIICVTVGTPLLVFGNWEETLYQLQIWISVFMNYSENKYHTTRAHFIFHWFRSFQVCH